MGAQLKKDERKQPKGIDRDRRVDSFKDVDLGSLWMPVIAVYEHPGDDPEHCVARVYDIDNPTNIVMVKDTVEEIEKDIRTNTELTFFPRGAEDVKSLLGIWW